MASDSKEKGQDFVNVTLHGSIYMCTYVKVYTYVYVYNALDWWKNIGFVMSAKLVCMFAFLIMFP